MSAFLVGLSGLDRSRAFRTDFSEPARFITPIRPQRRPEPQHGRDHRKMHLFEGSCQCCGKHFSREVDVWGKEPMACSTTCAARLRWTRTGKSGFGRRKVG